MEHQLWKAIVAVLLCLDNLRTPARFDFSDEDIVKVYSWAVLGDRPTSWACRTQHWPAHLRKPQAGGGPAALHRHHGKPVPGLRAATEEGPGRGGAAVRQPDELGRRAHVPAGLGADPSPGPPVGPGQARAAAAETAG